MHIRGKRLGIWAILVSLIFSFFTPLFEAETVEASSKLPRTIKAIAVDKKDKMITRLGSEMTSPSWLMFITDSILTGKGPEGLSRTAGATGLVEAFATDKITSSLAVNKLKFRETVQGNDCKVGAWKQTFECLYHEIYANVDDLDNAMDGMLTKYSRIADFNGERYSVSTAQTEAQAIERYKEDVKDFEEYVTNEILPNVVLLQASIKLLGVVAAQPELQAVSNTIIDFQPRQKDLDYQWDGRTLKQANRVHKRTEYLQAIESGGGAGTKSDESVYASSEAVYSDVLTLSDALLDPDVNAISSLADIETRKSRMINAAKLVDGVKGGRSSGDASRFERCGQASGALSTLNLNIGETITAALCSIVILVQQFSIDMLTTSLLMLGKVSGIQDLEPAGGETAGFLVALIPQEFTAEFLELALDPPPAQSGDNDTIKAARSFSPVIKNAHGVILNVVNVLLILLFIFIALSNILQIQVNNYSVQKMFAPIVIGFILASGSWFIVRGAIELASAASGGILTQFKLQASENGKQVNKGKEASNNFLAAVKIVSSVGGDPDYSLTETDANGEKRPSFSKVFQQSVLNSFSLAASIVVFILTFLFMIRALFLSFLIPLSPIAFFASAVPPLKSVWSKWSKPFFQWLIMPIIAAFWLWLGFVWLASVNIENNGTNAVQAIIAYLFGMVCFVAAIKSSVSSLSGEAKMAMDKWQGMGKKAWGATGGAALKSGQLAAGRGLKTFAYNKNLLGVPGILERNKQREAIAKQKLENAQKKYGARDSRNNRVRAAELARLKTQSEIYDGKKKQMETRAKLDDAAYTRLQRGLSKLNSYQEELDGLMKKRIKLEKNAMDVAPGFLSKGGKSKALKLASDDYHRLKADSILLNKDIANKELKDFKEFEDFIDGKVDGKVVNDKYLLNARRNADGTFTSSGNAVRNAQIKEDAAKERVKKLEEEVKMGEAAKFNRASTVLARAKYTADKGEGLDADEASRFRSWIEHGASYYEEGVHEDLGKAYRDVLQDLGDGEISAEKMKEIQGSLDAINKNPEFATANEMKVAMLKGAGKSEGMFIAKKGTDISNEFDVEKMMKLASKDDASGLVHILSGDVHELGDKAKDVEHAQYAHVAGLLTSDYEARQVAILKDQLSWVDSEKATAKLNATKEGQVKVQEAKAAIEKADKLLQERMATFIERQVQRDNQGNAKVDGEGKSIVRINQQDKSFVDAFGGLDKLREKLESEHGLTTQDYLEAMSNAGDNQAKSRFATGWKDSGAADQVNMGKRVKEMSTELRKPAPMNIKNHPEF